MARWYSRANVQVKPTEFTSVEHWSASCHLRELLSIAQSSHVSTESLETLESQGARL